MNAGERPAINARSITLGLLGVLFICSFTSYNDYVLNNTFLVGNNLPLGVTMLLFLFTLVINGPLSKWAPRHALSSGEVAVAFMMTLVSCALPSSGLMRALPASLVAPFNEAGQDGRYWQMLRSLNLPPWLFPKFTDATPWTDPVVQGFVTRGPAMYAAWLVPILAWAVFIFALYAALICMMTIVRRQWFENERLPFPLAQIQLSLVEQPKPGRWFNELMRCRSFWIAFFAVFLLHVWNGLSRYFPQNFPEIWTWYDIRRLVTEPPWTYTDIKLQDAAIFFSVLGAMYFVPSSIAFSLWFFFIINNVARMSKGTLTGEPDNYGVWDEHLGGLLAFGLTILWIGRRHWKLVVAQAFRGEREGEPHDQYLPHRFAFWCLVACVFAMIIWLWLAGMTWIGAIVTVAIVLWGFLIITRIIAETGLVHGQIYVSFVRPWTLIAAYAKSGMWLHPVPTKTFFLGTMIESHHYDYREVLPVYASHGLKVADETIDRRHGRKLIWLIALALFVGYFTSFYSMLWTEYHYAFTKDTQSKLVNDHGALNLPRGKLVMYPQSYDEGSYYLRHDPAPHIGLGFGITALLGFLRLRYAWWPLHPIGFLMVGTFPGAHLWLSIFAGWLCKTMIVKFGGSHGFAVAKPFFLGLIVGESAAAGFWLVMGFVLSSMGLPYQVIHIMPG